MVKVRGASDTPICISDIELIAPLRYGESSEVLAVNGKASHCKLICGEQVSQFSLPTRLKFRNYEFLGIVVLLGQLRCVCRRGILY